MHSFAEVETFAQVLLWITTELAPSSPASSIAAPTASSANSRSELLSVFIVHPRAC